MSSENDKQQPILQATAQPVPTVGEGCLSRFDPDVLNEQHGADFSAAEKMGKQWLAKYNTEQTER